MSPGDRSGAVREEPVSVVTGARLHRGDSHSRHPCKDEAFANRSIEVQPPVDRADGIKNVAEMRKNLFTDFVAAAPDVRAYIRQQLRLVTLRVSGELQRGGAGQSGEDSPPAGVHHAYRRVWRGRHKHDGHAVRIEHE